MGPGQQLIEFLRQLVAPLAQALPTTTEVVLHDLSLLPNSIVAIAGGVTDRTVGDPASEDAVHAEVPSAAGHSGEAFVRSVDELAATLIDREITSLAIPVELMKKRHKMQVVSGLEARGMFMLRDAVDTIAAALKVTRYTIYNYLNEIAADRGAALVRSAVRSRTRQQGN